MSAKVFKNNKLIVVLCCYNFYCTDWFVLKVTYTITSLNNVGDSVSLGQRVVSYPVNFVTGAINNLFSSNKTTDNKKIKQLEAKMKS